MENREPNSKECAYGGYKLSNIVPECQTSENVSQVTVGCDDDDTFYKDTDKSGRVVLEAYAGDEVIQIDLEDLLGFACRYCNGIYERVRSNITPES